MTAGPFDARLLRRRLERRVPPFDPLLRDEIAWRLVDRLASMRRRFERVLELAAVDDALERAMARAGLPPFPFHVKAAPAPAPRAVAGPSVLADPEFLPFADAGFDLVIAAGGLHWCNDLPGVLVQIRAVLGRDGLFLAGFPGGATLVELRTCLVEAELELTGGASPRVAPMVDLADAAALLQRAGFSSPVADLERVALAYRDPARLLADLRAMRESAAFASELRRPLRGSVVRRALELYRERFRGPEGTHPATLDLVFLAGFGGRPEPREGRSVRRA
ncbi:MAG: methyltransferase domain-containing protein [Geminicoccaceae bacterium]|nr:methyltransferase domain-containing protein [Geminicoccaceae bacterium]MCS7267083.1 methyltransferase domain-containing protein [Geminicoccaceae bacterium]MCX7630501.1 methyltransferase domain-containing protein [Geminicoccaceae bacterium]MDW8124954.1 methyltransferase domain-containing protein [Geminicoccaceae bacterium]MDW8342264.1 methyltransferase domain-containing protein [Geminicoccaceae bacterium]